MQVSSGLMPPGHPGAGPHGLGMPQPMQSGPGPQSQGGSHSSSARQSANIVS